MSGTLREDEGSSGGSGHPGTGDTARLTSSAPSGETHGTFTTPQEAMLADEVVRWRKFILVCVVFVIAFSAMLPWLGGDPRVERVLLVCLAISLAALGLFHFYIRDVSHYSHSKGLVMVLITGTTSLVACACFGFFSPAPLIFMLGISFFSPGSSRIAALVAYLYCATILGAAMLLTAAGVLPDLGVVRADAVSMRDKLLVTIGVQVMLLATYLFGRMARRSTEIAVEKLERAVRQVGQRDALLQEANQLLDKALRAGEGRYSGQQVGRWRLGGLLGRGAMGEVYNGRQVDDGREAAVKVLYAEVMCEPERIRRFLHEAEIMSRLNSPNVVQVYDVGDGSAGPPFIAMERVDGTDLHTHLRKHRRLSRREVVDLVEQVAGALEAARQADIVHRDIKPQNIIFCGPASRRTWKVVDFGVSKISNEAATVTGKPVGTPGYMAPEQAQGKKVSHLADVFALAAVAYRALTGRPAFSGTDPATVLFDLAFRQPFRPSDLTKLHEDVDYVLALGLAKSPEDRLPTAVAFARALKRAVSGKLSEAIRQQGGALVARFPWRSPVAGLPPAAARAAPPEDGPTV
jgi:predicted Ser/Thr protein kinase